ncbi:uncharacterized protein V1510DRAFT_381113 [Dipodascopsis tothii]|uniref:uncharacterized protein n=1 Tax=Dipodascopsis tothii TaxID=44089 RepID=UPI0034CF9780
MSYSSHRGINVSQYIANLNSLEPLDFQSEHKQEDLSLFTNTQFFDFDMGRSTDVSVAMADEEDDSGKKYAASVNAEKQNSHAHDVSPSSQASPAAPIAKKDGQKVPAVLDFLSDYNSFNYPMNLLPGQIPQSSVEHVGSSPMDKPVAHPGMYASMFHDAAANGHPSGKFPSGSVHHMQQYNSTQMAGVPSVSGVKRGSDTMSPMPGTPEESSRIAAEEDKRRRNTAASARFRIKKKQREQAMERTAKELQDKVQQLEGKIMQLEMENKWLKNLVVEKNSAKSVIDIMGRDSTDKTE